MFQLLGGWDRDYSPQAPMRALQPRSLWRNRPSGIAAKPACSEQQDRQSEPGQIERSIFRLSDTLLANEQQSD